MTRHSVNSSTSRETIPQIGFSLNLATIMAVSGRRGKVVAKMASLQKALDVEMALATSVAEKMITSELTDDGGRPIVTVVVTIAD